MYKFASASDKEPIVFGSTRPGYCSEQVNEWVEFMQVQGIQRVCCLLTDTQLRRYDSLLDDYRQVFGSDRVCWAPIEDFQLANLGMLIHQILPFLAAAKQREERVVVHCSGGIGRTGHVLAAWLVAGRGYSQQAAVTSVRTAGRNPYEAVITAPFRGRNPWKVASELHRLLDACSQLKELSA
jgi:protein-tyrosine phosphatase